MNTIINRPHISRPGKVDVVMAIAALIFFVYCILSNSALIPTALAYVGIAFVLLASTARFLLGKKRNKDKDIL
ncbi:hypothetical protein [Olivibacter sitiensis]|uniref:hypothetical protein n=1 Tax=Olivibacter sitiensis TaxID=376470 RepID=UPI000402F6B5|nr:hypothetical protein [Olivibacter sitiensis]